MNATDTIVCVYQAIFNIIRGISAKPEEEITNAMTREALQSKDIELFDCIMHTICPRIGNIVPLWYISSVIGP